MKKLILVAVVSTAISACAKSPESIEASYVSPTTYQSFSCSQLASEAARVDAALSSASAQQRKARTNDTVGVILIGLPTSSLSGGNVSEQVASLKGQKKTIQQTQISRNCISVRRG